EPVRRVRGEGMIMKRTISKDTEQGSDEWLQLRCGIVTASTMRNLVTASGKPADNDTSRGFIRQLATERIIGVPEYTYPTRPMQRGTMLEPYARDLYAEHYAPVEEVGFIRLDTDEYSLGYSPDGLVGHDGLLERSEEHTSELQSRFDLVCRLLLEKKNLVVHGRLRSD